MTFSPLPTTIDDINPLQWESFAPYFEELEQRPLGPDAIRQWLEDWSHLKALLDESFSVIYVAKTIDTADNEKEAAFLDIINLVMPKARVADHTLNERLLAFNSQHPDSLGDDMALVVRKMQNAADLFREENIPLQTELMKLDNEYDKITGAMSAEWEGETKNLSQLDALLEEKDRPVRQKAWQTIMGLWLGSRSEINQIYANMLAHRKEVAANAGLADFREYAFRDKERFDYTPEECFIFHEAIEKVVVPAASRLNARKARQLGLDRLRPWDADVDPSSAPPLKPYQGQEALIQGSLNVLHQVDPTLAGYLAVMAEEELLDLETRPGKALGGYCTYFPVRKRPFIFMNGANTHGDIQTILHEAGHAFHDFEAAEQPLIWQMKAPMEFCEVASMSMEMIASPFLRKEYGAFYDPPEAARARIQALERFLTFLPYMAVVDAFQHWVYTHIDEAMDPANCDAAWDNLWARFMPDIDWTGCEESRKTGWHRKPHIFGSPFYYIEYGLAEVGALQLWRNSLTDLPVTVQSYRRALALGGTKTIPELFRAAGAEFRFDVPMLADLVGLMEKTLEELETAV